jgi:outer membrane protein assembly factor BamB
VRTTSVIIMLAAMIGAGAAAGGAEGDWPGYRGPNAAGVCAPATPLPTLDAATWKEAWRLTLGASFSEIAVAGDRALVFVTRDGGEAVVCLNARTGKELWATRIADQTSQDGNGQGPRATPAVCDGKVYVSGSSMALVCLDLATGAEVWRREVANDYAGRKIQWGPAASVVIADDVAVVVGGGPGKGILGFERTTGKLAWGVTDEVHTHATPTVATIHGQPQVICFMVSGLVAVAPKTGAVLWRFPLPFNTSTAASAVVGGKHGDIVYCSAGYGVGAAAGRVTKAGEQWTVQPLWRNKVQNHWASGVQRDGFLYCLDGFKNDKCPLICLDLETGATRWSQPGFGSQGGLILVGDKLLVQTPAGHLVLVAAAPAAYQELGRLPLFQGKQCWIAPAFAHGAIFTRSTTESVCLRPAQP